GGVQRSRAQVAAQAGARGYQEDSRGTAARDRRLGTAAGLERLKLVLATFNPDKARELTALLDLPGVEIVTLAGFPGAAPPEETGATLEENATLKAEAACRLTGLPAIADDTGLEVDALQGVPGVHAARFAGPGASYGDNFRLLLARLENVPPARRTARF